MHNQRTPHFRHALRVGLTLAVSISLLGSSVTAVAAATPNGCTISGTDAADTLRGSEGDDVICGGGGNDLILGLSGADELRGGAGDDRLLGGDGSDRLLGEDGDDHLLGELGDDDLSGGNGSDSLDGSDGADALHGGNEADTLIGGEGNDELAGDNDGDVLDGGPGADKLAGDNGDDTVYGGFGDDTIDGGKGDDELFAGPGADAIDGGSAPDSCDGGTGTNEFVACSIKVDVGGSDPEGSHTDVDNDGVFDTIELRAGTDPQRSDSDHDGLSDSEELLGVTDPTERDSDGNGVADASDDADSDGLSNLQEAQSGSSPGDPDTDHDGLADDVEQREGTDALSVDSDDDGLTDAQEAELGTDASAADTDGDGTRDSDESFTREVTSTSTEASLVITARGASVLAVSIEKSGDVRLSDVAGQVSSAVDVVSPGAISGTVTIPFDNSGLTSASDVAVLHFDEERQVFDRPADQTIDLDAGIAHVTTDDFSPFVVVNVEEFTETWLDAISAIGGSKPLDVIFLIESSGFMIHEDPTNARIVAAKALIDRLGPDDQVSVWDFDGGSKILQGYTSDFAAAKAAVDTIDSRGNNAMTWGLFFAGGYAESRLREHPERKQIIITLTRGATFLYPYVIPGIANDATEVTVLDFGDAHAATKMNELTSKTGGKYFHIPQNSLWSTVIGDFGGDLGGGGAGGPDADDDGIADEAEIQGWRDGAGRVFVTDPNNPDTDGDELLDGEEAGGDIQADGGFGASTYYAAMSDPTQVDSDGDTLDDAYEVAEGLSAWHADIDYDTLSDGGETQYYSTEPFLSDTDSDGFADLWELQHESDGFDPLFYDVVQTPLDYASEFARGALCGDINGAPFCETGSVAYLIGNIASGIIAIGDIRDAFAGAFSGDFVSAGLSVIGIVPIVGDGVSIARKGKKLIDSADAVAAGPILRTLMKGAQSNADKVRLLEDVAPNAITKLRAAGVEDAAIVNIAKRMSSAKHLDDLIASASVIKRHAAVARESVAEASVRAATPGALRRQKLTTLDGSRRFYDVQSPELLKAIEVKFGRVKAAGRAGRQAKFDRDILGKPTSDIRSVEWHFFANLRGSFGPDEGLLKSLKEYKIPFVLYVP